MSNACTLQSVLGRLLGTTFMVVIVVQNGSGAHALSSSPRREAFRKSVVAQAASFFPPPLPGADLISSSLISRLAVLAIKSRLKEEREVTCEVGFSSSDLLLNGRVGPVTVKGKDWGSGRGLTCRAIEATVDQCELSTSKILTNQKLQLTTPAIGRAMVALNARDFGNFIVHPLMKPPSAIDGDDSKKIKFLPDGTLIDPATAAVIFYATYTGTKWRCVLQRSPMESKKAMVTVSSVSDEASLDSSQNAISDKIAELLQLFFNEMVFNLDGTYLSFRDMMVTSKGEAPSVMLSLNIKVHKLPSPGIEF